MTTQRANAPEEGLVLTGQLVGLDDSYSFSSTREIDPETGLPRVVTMKPAVKLLVGTSIVKVPFDPERVSARDLLGDSAKGELVSIPVRASGPWDAQTRRSAPVSFRVFIPAGPAPVDGELAG